MKNVVIVGFGFMGGMHAQAWMALKGASLAALVDRDPDRIRKQVTALKIQVPVFSRLEEALAAVPCDIVDICTPTDTHLELARLALASGRHVFCEKPLAYGPTQAAELARLAGKAKGRFMTGHCIRFWPEYQAAEAFHRSGKGGKLLSLKLVRQSSQPLHSAGSWLLDSKRSGGAALDLHIHDTDWVLHLLGKPKSVTSRGTFDKTGLSHIFTSYEFPKVTVQAEGGWNYPATWGFRMAFQMVFEKAVIDYDSGATPSLTVATAQGKKPLAFSAPKVGQSRSGAGNLSSLGGYANELATFLACVEKKKPVTLATASQAAESVRVAWAEIESARTGRPVPV